jgi:hypothetical protein
MPSRATGFVICVENKGAEDLDVRKVYRVLADKAAALEGYLRILDDSGEDYLYPADYFVFVELPQRARIALEAKRRPARRRSGSAQIAPRQSSMPVSRLGR